MKQADRVNAHLVGANGQSGRSCGHEPAEFLDGERAEEVLGVRQQLADQPDQRVEISNEVFPLRFNEITLCGCSAGPFLGMR
jgi:hypothetical protein